MPAPPKLQKSSYVIDQLHWVGQTFLSASVMHISTFSDIGLPTSETDRNVCPTNAGYGRNAASSLR
jgi:hypothetical protein